MNSHLNCLVKLGKLASFCIVDLGLPNLHFVHPIAYHLWIDNWNTIIGLTHHSFQGPFGCQSWMTKCFFIIFLEVRCMSSSIIVLYVIYTKINPRHNA